MQIENAKALVTGGSSGIGFATARLLKEKGAQVAICGRDRERLERAAAELGAVAIHADVSSESDVAGMMKTGVEPLRGYHMIINNARCCPRAALLATKPADLPSI